MNFMHACMLAVCTQVCIAQQHSSLLNDTDQAHMGLYGSLSTSHFNTHHKLPGWTGLALHGALEAQNQITQNFVVSKGDRRPLQQQQQLEDEEDDAQEISDHCGGIFTLA